MKVVGGSASVTLARGIARELSVDFVDVAFEKHPGGFPDGERYVRLLGLVSGEHVVLVQTTHPGPMIVELFLLADAIRDAGARRLTAVGIVEDVTSTGGTMATAAKELKTQGARRVIAACVHGLFVGPAEANLKVCDDVIATDTVLSPHTKVSVAPEFAAAIRALR